MFFFYREAVMRFIRFVVKRVKAPDNEERLRQLNEFLLYFVYLLVFIIASLIVNLVIANSDNKDLRESLSKLSVIFRKENNPLEEFVTMNNHLTDQVKELSAMNIRLVRDNVYLVDKVDGLQKENNLLKGVPERDKEMKNKK